jgi:nucleotide-binding universal stress UspA family protein
MGALEQIIPSPETIFSRILVGIDGSPEALEAAAQAAALAGPQATLELVSAWHLGQPVVTGMPSVPTAETDGAEVRRRAEDAAAAAALEFPAAHTQVVHGPPGDVLLATASDERSTLIAVGSHGLGRMPGIVFGSTATRVIHDAPCSVLVARSGRVVPPSRIVVGVDGSEASARAFGAARHLAERFGGEVVPVVAEGHDAVDLPAISLAVGDSFHVTPGEPVPVLTAAAANADLLVVGSRGLRGLRALGSVSERVAHRADCSTLIVR